MANYLFKRLSLVPAGLRYKLTVVFCLMSLIPLMICVYIATNFAFPYITAIGSLSIIIVITMIIAFLGFELAKRMIEPIIDMALEAKLIAGGDFERSIKVTREDEIGDLANSLNTMTQKIRQNINELESYGEKTREINIEIHKKVMALSGLLQVGNLISAATDLKTVLDILADKISAIDGPTPTLIMMVDEDKDNLVPAAKANFKPQEAAEMPVSLQHGIFAELKAELNEIIIDRRLLQEKEDKNIRSFKELYRLKNSAILPIVIMGELRGVIVVGNNEDDYKFKDDDIELLRVFCKQAAIAIENDYLLRKTEELEVRDDLTQLYNSKYIKDCLEEEIKRAILYQRPCSFILLNVDNFKEFCQNQGRVAGESALKKIASTIAKELTPGDKAARFNDDEFALVLPERNKKEAKQIAEELKKKIAGLVILPGAAEEERHLTVSGSLSENPIDGVLAKELISKAQELLKEAKAEGKNIIKV